jgi:hypothetical protein
LEFFPSLAKSRSSLVAEAAGVVVVQAAGVVVVQVAEEEAVVRERAVDFRPRQRLLLGRRLLLSDPRLLAQRLGQVLAAL